MQPLKIGFVGDIAFFGRFSTLRSRDLASYFSDVSEYLAEFDFVVGNLETPLCSDLRPIGAKSAHIKGSPDDVELLRSIGVSHVNLANNHVFDFGEAGYKETIEALDNAGVDHFGVSGKVSEIVTKAGKVALHGLCGFETNPKGARLFSNRGVCTLDLPAIQKIVAKYTKKKFLNVLSIHGDTEHVNYPSQRTIKLARLLAEQQGPYVLHGHHPHVMQGVEVYKESVLAYSLGNFCFDDVYTQYSGIEPVVRQSLNNKTGLILGLEVCDDKIQSHSLRCLYMGSEKIELDPKGASDALAEYSSALSNNDFVELQKRRAEMLNGYLENRKKGRSFSWYAKRLNFRSLELLRDIYWNRICQWVAVDRHLNKY